MTRMPVRLTFWFAAAAAVATLAACGGSSSDDDEDNTPAPIPGVPAPAPAPTPSPSPAPSPTPSPPPPAGPQPADALAGRWVPVGCGNLDVGGTESTYRGYHLNVKTSANTLELRTNTFNYSAPNCSGTRTPMVPESQSTLNGTLTMGSVESLNGFTVYRVMYAPQRIPGGQPAPAPYQTSYTFTPQGLVCLSSHSEGRSTSDLVDSSRGGGATNCGTMER